MRHLENLMWPATSAYASHSLRRRQKLNFHYQKDTTSTTYQIGWGDLGSAAHRQLPDAHLHAVNNVCRRTANF